MEASGLMGIRTPSSRIFSGAKNLWDEFALQVLHCAVIGIGTGTWSVDVPSKEFCSATGSRQEL